MTHKTLNLQLSFGGGLYIDDVECTFDVEFETVAIEPYSYGESRGDETTVRTALISAVVGDSTVTPDQLEPFIGLTGISSLEDQAQEKIYENLETT